jgi:alpha-tubulin suppressor-like RCC1 family protein
MYTGPGTVSLYSIWDGNTQRSSPVQVGTETNWAYAAAGNRQAFGIKNDGTLWGWGSGATGFPYPNNANIQVVDSPVQIGTNTWSSFTLGLANANFSGIQSNGTLWSWGDNTFGQVGDNTTVSRSSPVQLGTRTDWRYISNGASFSMAIRNDNTLWSWGRNNIAQLGLGIAANRSSPIQVGTDTDWSSIFAGETHSAGIRTFVNNDLYTAGVGLAFNSTYEGINGWTYPRQSPIMISQTNPWNVLSVGATHSLGVKPDGTLWAWGRNVEGQLGLGDVTGRFSPVQIGTRTDWADASSTSNNYSLALTTSGTLWAWGLNSSGQLGLPTFVNFSSPVQVGTRSGWSRILATYNNTSVAVHSDGTLWTWGVGSFGLNESPTLRSSPVQVGTETNWLAPQNQGLVPSGGPFFARKTNKSLYVFAGDERSNAGITFRRLSPIQVTSAKNWRSVHAGTSFTIAISDSGSIWGWGNRTNGVLGGNTLLPQYQESPVQIGTLTTWVSASVSDGHILSVRTNGTMWGWGINNVGQLGLGDVISRSSPVQIGTLTNWKDISAGRSYTMAIKTDGTMWGWGLNNNNQLGNASGISHSSPVQIGTRTWTVVSAGVIHTAAIRSDGTLWAWGNGASGQLGQGNVSSFNSPVQVGTLTGWTDVAAGPSMTMAVRGGALWSWGLNSNGQLGLLRDRSRPNYVVPTTTFRDISAGSVYFVGIASNQTLWGWGTNTNGQLGLNDTVNRSSPVQISTRTWNKISVGGANGASIAISTDGTLWSWGSNAGGELGSNLSTLVLRSSPVQVGTLNDWKEIDMGGNHVVSIKTDGTLWTWGNATSAGQLGLNDTVSRSSPVQLGTDTNWLSATASLNYTVALKTSGTLWTWGLNSSGQLGLNDTINRSSSVQIGTRTWNAIASMQGQSSTRHSLAIRNDGTLWGWGRNVEGQLGLAINMTIPRAVNTSVKFVDAKVGQTHGIAISTAGTLWMWGGTASNQYTPQSINSPVQIGTRTWSRVAAQQTFSGAIRSDGTLWMWGTGTSGQLGQNNTSTFNSPVQVGTRNDWSSIKAGNLHSMAIRNDGTLWGWGSAQLGDNISVARSSPVQIGTDTNWSYVSPGDDTTFGLKTNGTLWGWGLNTSGQLGLNNTINHSSPVQIGTETNWSKLSDVYRYHTMAIKTNGTLWSWGVNFFGNIGDGTTITRSSPVQIGTRTDWKDAFAGTEFSMAIRNDGTLWSWGTNTNGQLGIGDTISRSSPVQVGTLNTWVSASLGLQNTVLLVNDGTALTSGTGTQAEGIDTGFTVTRSSPVQIGTLNNWVSAFVGDDISMAIRSDRTLWAWGVNTSAQLGIGDAVNRSSPVQIGTLNNWVSASVTTNNVVVLNTDGYALTMGASVTGYDTVFTPNRSSPMQIGIDTNWQKVKASSANHPTVADGGQFIAQKTNGTLWTWGANTFGNLGDGTTITRSSPVQIGNETSWVDFSAEGFHFTGIKRY